MSDYLVRAANTPALRGIIKSIGLPTPQTLTRAEGGYAEKPLKGKTVLFGVGGQARVDKALEKLLADTGAEVIRSEGAGVPEDARYHALVMDATGMTGPDDLKDLYSFFNPTVRKLQTCGRVVVLADVPETAGSVASATAARAVEGFVRSLGKEIGKKGATANLIYVEKGAEDRLAGPLRFFLSAHSAYVDGQAARVTQEVRQDNAIALYGVLKGKVALVTGGARGIGAATAGRLAAEGAHVVCLDIPADEETLNATVQGIGGTALPLDITDSEAPAQIAAFLKDKFGGVDIVVHNAGVTRDKTLANMKEQFWDMVLNINLAAILRINEVLIGQGIINDNGRVVCLSSIGGIAGNMGQTNYGATKAGLIGYVRAEADNLAGKGICINAVAPGFIETRMTAEIPFVIREAGRRLCSLSQGGQPIDVAELICFLSSPGALGITGQTIRVCGQNLVGA